MDERAEPGKIPLLRDFPFCALQLQCGPQRIKIKDAEMNVWEETHMENMNESCGLATACAAVELLQRSGMSLKEAQVYVAQNSKYNHVALRNFADDIRHEQPKSHQEMIDTYWRQLSIAKKFAEDNPRYGADVLLSALEDSLE